MSKFTDLARKATEFSPLMNNREKATVEEIIERFPDGVTIVGVDMVSITKKEKIETFPVLIIKEDDDIFFFGGFVLTKIVNQWSEGYIDFVELSKDLEKQGGVKVKMFESKTSTGNNLINVTILG